MKQAQGELMSGLIVVVAVGVLAVFFFMYLWPIIKGNWEGESKCSSAICVDCNVNNDNMCICHTKDNPTNEFKCVYKG